MKIRFLTRYSIPSILLLSAAFMVFIEGGCNKQMNDEPYVNPTDYLDDYLADASNPLFANLESYLQDGVATKSSINDYVPLSSLIDLNHGYSIEGDDYCLTEYPFFSNSDRVFFCHSNEVPEFGSVVSPDSLMILKKFFVTEDTDAHNIQFVASVLADQSYYNRCGIDSVSFIHMPNFAGVVLLSYLDGTFDSVYQYKDGLELSSRMLRYFETAEDSSTVYLTQVQCEDAETKVYGGPLNAASVVASQKIPIRIVYESQAPKTDGRPFGVHDPDEEPYRRPSGGGIHPNKKTYTVTLSADHTHCGTVSGGGTYSAGSFAYIEATPISAMYSFEHWDGDFSYRGPKFSIVIERNYSSEAYFIGGQERRHQPCVDKKNNKANMLKFMSIAATCSGNYIGGTYGSVRKKKVTNPDGTYKLVPKNHNGYDFAADVGTPIYAQYDGTMGMIVTGCPSGNGGEDGKRYNGSYGNTIKFKFKSGNDNIEFMYAHLDYDPPVAINPRTGKPFKEGDAVERGDLIGYSGKSGNAWDDNDVPNKHVHWEVWKNGTRIDGKDYINGTVDKSSGQITGIKCD